MSMRHESRLNQQDIKIEELTKRIEALEGNKAPEPKEKPEPKTTWRNSLTKKS